MGEASSGKAFDVFAWFLNVSTSVLIVFVNKLLMDAKNGYAFTFGEFQAQQRLYSPHRTAL
jgi:hypothetical protein